MRHILVSHTPRMLIRNFVGYTGAAAGVAAALALSMSAQPGFAAPPSSRVNNQPTVAQEVPSAECTAAIQAIRAAVAADASEDASERAVAKTNPELAVDPSEDAAELTNLQQLFNAARAACFPAVKKAMPEPGSTTFSGGSTTAGPSAACIAAIQALKEAWRQAGPMTQAKYQELQRLAQAARAACGWNVTIQGR
jgi:hypothetical protein